MPSSPYSLNFQDFEDPLAVADFEGCLGRLLQHLLTHIQQHGDGPAPVGFARLRWRYQTVIVEFYNPGPDHVERPILYNDSTVVFAATSLKMRREGYRERMEETLVTEIGAIAGDLTVRKWPPFALRPTNGEEEDKTLQLRPRNLGHAFSPSPLPNISHLQVQPLSRQ